MKTMRLIVAGLMMSALFACAVLEETTEKAINLTQQIHTLKTQGCDALSEPVKESFVRLIKTRLEHYPDNGICNPEWVRDVLLGKVAGLEKT